LLQHTRKINDLCRCYRLILRLWCKALIFVLVLLHINACKTSPDELVPEKYVDLIDVKQNVQHASLLLNHQSILKALEERNLVIAENGIILPFSQAACNAQLYYKIGSSLSVPAFIGRHQDLISGFYIDLMFSNGDWQVLNNQEDGPFASLDLSVMNSFLLPLLNPFDRIVVNVVNRNNIFVLSTEELTSLKEKLAQSYPSHDVEIFVNASPITQILGKQQTIIKPTQKARLVVSSDLLNTCVEHAGFMNAPLLDYDNRDPSLAHLVLALPANADFTDISEQQALMQQGWYISWDGQRLSYEGYLLSKRTDDCEQLPANHPDRIYCIERKYDAKKLISDAPFIFKK
jgi:hypothetical protein